MRDITIFVGKVCGTVLVHIKGPATKYMQWTRDWLCCSGICNAVRAFVSPRRWCISVVSRRPRRGVDGREPAGPEWTSLGGTSYHTSLEGGGEVDPVRLALQTTTQIPQVSKCKHEPALWETDCTIFGVWTQQLSLPTNTDASHGTEYLASSNAD